MQTPDVTAEFDHNSPQYAQSWREIYQDLRKRCPVAHSPSYGGFYVLTKYVDVARALKDDATFASFHDPQPESRYGGIIIPPSPQVSWPIEMDPPAFNPIRKMLNPFFSPAKADAWQPYTHEVTRAMIDAVIETGSFDIVEDLASPVPAILTAALLGIPTVDWRMYADAAHAIVFTPPTDPAFVSVAQNLQAMVSRAVEVSYERRIEPKDDLLSVLVQHRDANGEPLTDEMIGKVALVVITGGADTTTGLVANALIWLYQHPEQRDWLRTDLSRLRPACEEFLRYFTPTQGLARTVTTDVEIGGHRLKAGDRVWMSFASANQDPDEFENPDEIKLDRFPNRHQAFGLGLHRCLGSNITRMEFVTIMAEVLTRIPDYVIDESASEKYENIGIVNGWNRIPATFPRGPRLGSTFRL